MPNGQPGCLPGVKALLPRIQLRQSAKPATSDRIAVFGEPVGRQTQHATTRSIQNFLGFVSGQAPQQAEGELGVAMLRTQSEDALTSSMGVAGPDYLRCDQLHRGDPDRPGAQLGGT